MVHRDAKAILPRNSYVAWQKTKSKKSQGRDPLAQPLLPQDMKSCGIPWGKSSLQPFRNQSTDQALQHLCGQHRAGPFKPPLLCLVSWVSNLPFWTAWNQPVGCCIQGVLRARLCWLQQPVQNTLPCIGFGRVGGTCPKSWHSCHSEHLHLHHFWSLKKGQGGTNRAAKGTRDFLYRNSYLNLIQKGNTKAIQRKATLEFLCKKQRTQGLLKHLLTNIHLLFISPIWINHLRNSITHRAEKFIYKRDIHPQNKMYRFIVETKREGGGQNQKQGHCSQTLTFSYRRDHHLCVSGVFNY